VTGPTLTELFDGVQESAFRFEGLEAYAVGGDEAKRIEAWRHHEPRPVRSIRTNDYLARIAKHALANPPIPWERVTRRHVPPTEYQRYRTAGDQESQTAGEIVSVLLPGSLDIASDLPLDFWLFDRHRRPSERKVAVMRYTEGGGFEGFDLIDGATDSDAITPFATWAERLIEAAIPLNRYLAQLDARTELRGA
jgi:hypothetical protein